MKLKKLLLPALILLAASLVTLIRQITAGTGPEKPGQHSATLAEHQLIWKGY